MVSLLPSQSLRVHEAHCPFKSDALDQTILEVLFVTVARRGRIPRPCHMLLRGWTLVIVVLFACIFMQFSYVAVLTGDWDLPGGPAPG